MRGNAAPRRVQGTELRRSAHSTAIRAVASFEFLDRPVPQFALIARDAAQLALSILDRNCPRAASTGIPAANRRIISWFVHATLAVSAQLRPWRSPVPHASLPTASLQQSSSLPTPTPPPTPTPGIPRVMVSTDNKGDWDDVIAIAVGARRVKAGLGTFDCFGTSAQADSRK